MEADLGDRAITRARPRYDRVGVGRRRRRRWLPRWRWLAGHRADAARQSWADRTVTATSGEESSMSPSGDQHTIAETEALRELAAFPLLEALYGRRSRRFALGDEI